jgi:hypothetical protein
MLRDNPEGTVRMKLPHLGQDAADVEAAIRRHLTLEENARLTIVLR